MDTGCGTGGGLDLEASSALLFSPCGLRYDGLVDPYDVSWWLATFRPDSPPRDAGAAVVLAEKVAALSEVAVAEPNTKRTTGR